MSTEKHAEVGFWQVVGSVFASVIGVQKNAHRERDFKHGKPLHYVIGGVLFTVVFVVSLLMLVKLVVA